MSLPLFLGRPDALDDAGAGSCVVLDGEEGRHAALVRRIRAGEHVEVADGAGRVARCRVDRTERDRLVLTVEDLRVVPPPVPRLVLVQALAKGGRDELAVETATEYGVDSVIPWQAERSVVRWSGDGGIKGRRRWEATARAAAKQARRATVPPVEPLMMTHEVSARVPSGGRLLVLHEEAQTPLTSIGPTSTDILLMVGPEGGIGPDELAVLIAAGGVAVRLGDHVLRSSSAGPAALAVLSVLLHRW